MIHPGLACSPAVYDKAIADTVKGFGTFLLKVAVAYVFIDLRWVALLAWGWAALQQLVDAPRVVGAVVGLPFITRDYAKVQDQWLVRLSILFQLGEAIIAVIILVFLANQLF